HELRNPLAPIRNAGEVLSRMLSNEGRARDVIEILKRQVAQLTRLVDDLLDVSRITQGRIELKRRPVHLAEIIAQAVETVAPLLREKRHDIAIVSGHPLTIDGDPARLVQSIGNILTNAAKYTDDGGKIRIETERVADRAIVSVSDNGVGIS